MAQVSDMDQTIVNILLACVSALMGFFINAVWQAVKDLQKRDADLAEKVSAIEVLVAGEYVKKSDFDRTVEALFMKLDRIEAKIDRKQDRTTP